MAVAGCGAGHETPRIPVRVKGSSLLFGSQVVFYCTLPQYNPHCSGSVVTNQTHCSIYTRNRRKIKKKSFSYRFNVFFSERRFFGIR